MILAKSRSLVLRRLAETDTAEFSAYRADPEVARYQGWNAMKASETQKFLKHMNEVTLLQNGKWTQLGLAFRDGDQLIGDIGVHIADDESEAELGITLASAAQGRGLGLEAVELVCAWLFAQTAIKRIVAITNAQNTRALALLGRSPFHHTHDTNDVIDGQPTAERWFERRRS